MLLSRDRILTTHVGSLPRNEVLTDLLIRREAGEAIDPATMAAEMDRAVRDIVGAQIAAGIDIGNDGEQQRVGFQTYIPARMSGFGGVSKRKVGKDFQEVPELIEHVPAALSQARQDFQRPTGDCRGALPRHQRPEGRNRALQAMRGNAQAGVRRNVHDRAVPGIVATTMMNAYYDQPRGLPEGARARDAARISGDPRSGPILQIDAPDLAMERTMTFQDQSDAEFVKTCERHMAALNSALEGIPRDRVRLHCCWGNWEGPHVHDIPLAPILPVLYQAKARRAHHRVRQSPPSARVRNTARQSVAEGLAADPGRDRHHHQFRGASRR